MVAFRQRPGRARLHHFNYRRDPRRSAVAPRRPLEPREEHLRDGARVEHRHHRVRLRAELLSAPVPARHRGRRRGGLRHRRRGAPRGALPRAHAHHDPGCLPGRGHRGLRRGRGHGRIHRATLGMAGGLRRRGHSRRGARDPLHRPGPRRCFRRAAARCERRAHVVPPDRRGPLQAALAPCYVHRRGPAAVGRVDLLGVDAELLQPQLRPRARSREACRRGSSCCWAAWARWSRAWSRTGCACAFRSCACNCPS